jgi:uncharacterized membrane protein
MFILTLITALGCGLIAGIFYAFSSFIMKSLGKLPPAQGIAAMQRINIDVINPWFMAVFMGTAATSAAIVVITTLNWDAPNSALRLAGALLYLVGTFGITIVFNVPLNNRLAKPAHDSPEAADLWTHYLKTWTAWNTVRTAAALAACAALIVAMCG